jgi:hypothetical protein
MTAPNALVLRSRIVEIEMLAFTKVTNLEAVISTGRIRK